MRTGRTVTRAALGLMGDITRPDGPCAPEIAHLPGVRVRSTYADLLDRAPDPGGAVFWIPRVQARDERGVVASIVASSEYITRSQVP